MAFAEPNMLNPQILIQKNVPWVKERVGDSPDETAFFRWQLGNWLSACGFTGIQIAPRDWLHPATPPNAICTVSQLGSFFERIPLLCETAGSLYIAAHKPL